MKDGCLKYKVRKV